MIWFGIFFNGILTFMAYLMPKSSLYKKGSDTIQLITGRIQRFNTFPKGISPKVNVIEQLEFKLGYLQGQSSAFWPLHQLSSLL